MKKLYVSITYSGKLPDGTWKTKHVNVSLTHPDEEDHETERYITHTVKGDDAYYENIVRNILTASGANVVMVD